MCEKGLVSKVLEARSIVSHDVVRSWDVLGDGTVAVESLVCALEVAEAWSGALGHCGSLVHAAHGRSVVCPDSQSGVADLMIVGHNG